MSDACEVRIVLGVLVEAPTEDMVEELTSLDILTDADEPHCDPQFRAHLV